MVASYAGVFVKGLQGEPGSPDFLSGKHVISSTKHFLADGGTENGRDQGDAKIPEKTLVDIHNAGYVPAIEAGVQTIMISFSSWNGVKHTGNKGLITDVLKKRMNFDGFTVGDWNAHGQVEGCTNDNCPQALNAGLDMYMAPDSWRGLYDWLGEELTPETAAAMQEWWDGSQEDRSAGGGHHYTPEEFGLDADELRERFAYYSERYPFAT